MDIIVLVKQVPDTESLIEIDADGVSIKKQDIKWVMNPYDEIAVEEALQIREAKGGSVTVVSMGGQKAIETIRTALAMGAGLDASASFFCLTGHRRRLRSALSLMP